MERAFKALALLLALLWVPMVSHCDLERLPGMSFLICSDEAESGSHQEKDCQTDSCASVEAGHYKTEEQAVRAPAPSLIIALILPSLDVQPLDLVAAFLNTGAFREEPPPNWVFAQRQAASSRAPSCVA